MESADNRQSAEDGLNGNGELNTPRFGHDATAKTGHRGRRQVRTKLGDKEKGKCDRKTWCRIQSVCETKA